MENIRDWRLMDVLQESTDYLARNSIENPRLNAERLLGKALDLSRVDLYLRFDQPLTEEERAVCRKMILRRSSHEPLQYILEETEFMSLPISVRPGVLIPRPETELLVQKAVEKLERVKNPVILDIGTGSGCIAVSLAHFLPESKIIAIDVSDEALKIASENAVSNQVEKSVDFIKADIKSPDILNYLTPDFDAVISNPPYITIEEWPDLAEEISKWEPRNALCDEGDGYSFYEAIADHMNDFLEKDGFVSVEVGDTQAKRVKQIFEASGLGKVQIDQDLTETDRIVTAYKI